MHLLYSRSILQGTFKFVYYVSRTEVSSRGREVIIDDEFSCTKFEIVYN